MPKNKNLSAWGLGAIQIDRQEALWSRPRAAMVFKPYIPFQDSQGTKK